MKSLRIAKLLWTRSSRVVEQNQLPWNFWVKVTWFFACSSGLLDWITLIWVWFERSFPSGEVSCQNCPWLLTLMTWQVVEGLRFCLGGYGQFRGEWVKWFRQALFTTALHILLSSELNTCTALPTLSHLVRYLVCLVYFLISSLKFMGFLLSEEKM